MKLLTNPFLICQENKLFIVGIVFAVLTVFISSFNGILLLGSLKVIDNYPQTWYNAGLNLLITLGTNVVLLYFFGLFTYSKTRFIDVLNVVLIAHIAVYVVIYLMATPLFKEAVMAVELEILDKGFDGGMRPTTKMFILSIFGVLVLCLLIYFFYLLVVGMKIAINSKRKIDAVIIVFIVILWNTALQFLNPFLSI